MLRRRRDDDSDGVRWEEEDIELELMLLLLLLPKEEEDEMEESGLVFDDSDAFCITASAEEALSLPNSCDAVTNFERSTSCKRFFHLL